MMVEQLASPFIFLSHSHADEGYVNRLLHGLQAQGIAVWIDRHAIPISTPDWEEAIRTAISQAAAVVLVASPHSRASQVVRDELDVALLYNRPVYPFWVDGQHWIESIPLGWGRVQHLDARRSRYEIAQTELLKLLQKQLSSTSSLSSLSSLRTPEHGAAHPVQELWSVPYRRNRFFTGRGSDLQTLHEQLANVQQIVVTQAISGLGGVGKTQLAVEYAYRFRSAYRTIFWIRAETQETFLSDLANLAVILALPEQHGREQVKIIQAVKHWLSRHSGWLLILDNVEDLSLVEEWTPMDHHGAILLTTRRHVTEPIAQVKELNVFSANDGALFLLKRAQSYISHTVLDEAPTGDVMIAQTISQQLGGLPLALDQAGAYIAETKCSLSDYLNLFRQEQHALLQRRGTVSFDHPQSVTATFALTFKQVWQKNEAAIELLKLCTFFALDVIPLDLVMQGTARLGSVLQSVSTNALQLDQALETLQAYSLLRRDGTSNTLLLHRLVQAVLHDSLEEIEMRSWAELVMLTVNAAFPHPEYGSWPECERLLPHALLAAQYIDKYQITGEEAGRLLYEIASYLRDRARYREAEPLYQRTLRIREQLLGAEHPDVAEPLNSLAVLYMYQGKYQQAKVLYQRAIQICEQHLGLDHLNVADPLNGLASLYIHQGKYEQAEPLYRRVLKIREQQLGPEHPDVAIPLSNLASLCVHQGKYEQAEPLYWRALQIYERKQGIEYPNVAYALNNLAHLYRDQGKYTEAEPIFLRALHICEQHLGLEHVDNVYPLDGLANLYRDQGKYAEAEPVFLRALQIYEQQLGSEHPDVAELLDGLANLYFEQGKHADAELRYLRALYIREQAQEPEHPKLAKIMSDLARLRKIQGNHNEARNWYTRALAICEQSLGTGHRQTTETRMHLITLLHTMGQHGDAALLEAIQVEQGTGKEEQKTASEE